MNYKDIRHIFSDYFKKHNHTIVPSSSLIPAEDPTLLFTNAGMNQFKDCFLGKENRSYKRASSIQKCVRAGGKHNDLDQVGYTARHLTFFEMMGSFSFGDYFKKEAIRFAWDLLTKEYKLPAEKLYVTVFRTDDEAASIWLDEIKIDPKHLSRLDEADNFWSMGDTGPCGPCTEIYFDTGKTDESADSVPGSDDDRFIEIWNLVFMQYNRDANGNLNPLKQTGVDTGMGFERLCMVMQNKQNVYQIDSFKEIIADIESLSGKNYAKSDPEMQAAFHVLSDHVRSTSLLIADGCSPSNDGRGYVLRKIIRRAALFAQKLSDRRDLFPSLAQTFIKSMGELYPELKQAETLIISILKNEIDRFADNLLAGQNILQKYIDVQKRAGAKTLSGQQMFKLYDTYGFPPELTRVITLENGLDVDLASFETEMQKQKDQSGKKGKDGTDQMPEVPDNLSTVFTGYEELTSRGFVQFVEKRSDHSWICLDRTCLYVESGGQVSDKGTVTIKDKAFPVIDLKKVGQQFKPAILIKVKTEPDAPTINTGDEAVCKVDQQHRADTMRNHTATHLLQAALRTTLGEHVKQAGSVVCPDYLRFDFSHHKPMSNQEIKVVEDLVYEQILKNRRLSISTTTLKQAQDSGVISFFGEKYNPESVRVVDIPGFSTELCGGTHTPETGQIGCFKIVSEAALATGTRRIVALTGPKALESYRSSFNQIKEISEQLKVKSEDVSSGVRKLENRLNDVTAELKRTKKAGLKTLVPSWLEKIEMIDDTPFLYLSLKEELDGGALREIGQMLMKEKEGIFFILNQHDQKVSFVCLAAKKYQSSLNLKELSLLLREHGLRGGGNQQAIQGGGDALPNNLKEKIQSLIK